jgi:alkylation response protein AidB-like acyl-CoA dehydrogenase
LIPETYHGRVRALLPVLRERAAGAEKLRRIPDETFADFQEAGLFRALQPKRYGGYELDPATFYQAVMEVGAVCGSSAWILGVIGVHNWHLAILRFLRLGRARRTGAAGRGRPAARCARLSGAAP